MAKQVVVGNCRECPFAWYEYLQMIPGWKCSHFEMHCRVSGEGIHPNCPLPDVQQCAASPWLPMSEAPKDGTELLLQISKNFYIVGFWNGAAWINSVCNGYTYKPIAFAYINIWEEN